MPEHRRRFRWPWVRRRRLDRAVLELADALAERDRARHDREATENLLRAACLRRGGRLRIPKQTVARAGLFALDVRIDHRPPAPSVVVRAITPGTTVTKPIVGKEEHGQGK